jgi:alcohol dehydrogenase (cytochrome c)
MVWYYQVSPHDVHDWDAVEAPVLIDGVVEGKPRKLLAQASRNGFYFLLDRTNGEHLVTKPFINTINWTEKINDKGQPIPAPAKYPKTDGTLVSPSSNGATNWPSPSFNPKTGLLYVGSSITYSLFYLTDTDARPEGWAGIDTVVGGDGGALLALDYKTGNVVWRHDWPSGNGVTANLSTAGNLLFTSNGTNFIAFDATTGKILWHAGLTGIPSNAPITYKIDGKQFILVAAGDTLYAFTLNEG